MKSEKNADGNKKKTIVKFTKIYITNDEKILENILYNLKDNTKTFIGNSEVLRKFIEIRKIFNILGQYHENSRENF